MILKQKHQEDFKEKQEQNYEQNFFFGHKKSDPLREILIKK